MIETPEWIQHAIAPPAWTEAALDYDSRRDRVVMFGGALPSSQEFGQTWEWTGGDWIQFAGAAPGARALLGLAYDAARGNTLLFGGFNGQSILADTWTWDGGTWTAHDISGPPPRAGHSMVYDAKRQRVVLFGGFSFTGGGFDDTWEWDGAAWHSITTAHAPHERYKAMMSYDPKRGVVVLAGGVDPVDGTNHFPDTWEYDGVDWTDVSPTSGPTPQLFESAMAYDVTSQQTILFGGVNPTTTDTATMLAWNGSAWSTVSATGPTARSGAAMASTAAGLVMYGGASGTTPNAETWLYANSTWSQPKDAGPRAEFAMANDPARARAIIFGGTAGAGILGDTWDLSTLGFKLRANMPPSQRLWPCIAYDVAHDNLVMFGGSQAGGFNTNAETWIWNGAGWSQRMPARSPPARALAACAFDGQHVTLFGGAANGAGTELADAWSWDGTTWTPITVPASLTARMGSAAAYDPVRKKLVLTGGAVLGVNGQTYYQDTYTYDGMTWILEPTGFAPTPRWRATLTWNPARQTLILAGGASGGAGAVMDAYEWDGTAWHTIAVSGGPENRFDHGAISSIDGSGIQVFGGSPNNGALTTFDDRWELRWDSDHAHERCNSADLDGDHLDICADPDCWWVCTPLCPPGTTCDPSAPRCGDGMCDSTRETCRTCPQDCTCAPVCGDGICDPGETACPGDCP